MAGNRDIFPAPSKAQEKPEMEAQSEDPVMEPVKVTKKGVEVVAIRSGFYKKVRRAEGQIFTIPSMESLGSWMKIVDPKLELERQKKEKAKKAGR